jgi:tetratricopeptide (TPR) repeat protein
MARWAAPLSGPIAALLVANLISGAVCADETPGPSAGAARAEPAAGAQAEREREALILRDRAFELFKEERYRDALPLLERAQELSRAPRHLFNLATAHHWLGQCASARDYFEQYLRAEPAGQGAAAARAALDELYQRCGREPVPAAPPAAPPTATLIRGLRVPAPPPPAPPPDHALSWSLIGVGVALGAASAASLVLMERSEADVEARARRAPVDGWTPEARALLRNGDRYATLSVAFGVTAVACVGAGVSLQLLAPSRTESFSVSLGGAPALHYRARF